MHIECNNKFLILYGNYVKSGYKIKNVSLYMMPSISNYKH